MPQAPNSTRRNNRAGSLHDGVKLGNGILVTQCWGVRQGEGQRIGRLKYLFTHKELAIEKLYPSRTSLTSDTAKVRDSAHGWVRIKVLQTLTTLRGAWGHTMDLGQIRVGPKFRGSSDGGRDAMEGSHNDLLIPKISRTAHNFGVLSTHREIRAAAHSGDHRIIRGAWCSRRRFFKMGNIEPHPITPPEGTDKATEIPKSSPVACKRVGHASQGRKWGSLVYHQGGLRACKIVKEHGKGLEIRYSRPILVLL